MFMQENELDLLKEKLCRHGIAGGLKGLMELALTVGRWYGMEVKPTCDAKYLEVGISGKSDNVDAIFTKIGKAAGRKQTRKRKRPEKRNFVPEIVPSGEMSLWASRRASSGVTAL